MEFIEKPASVIEISLPSIKDLFHTVISINPNNTYSLTFSISYWNYDSTNANKWNRIPDGDLSGDYYIPNYDEAILEFNPDEHVPVLTILNQYKNYPILFHCIITSNNEDPSENEEALEFESNIILTGFNELAPEITPEPPVNVSSKHLVGNPVFVEYSRNLSVTLVVLKFDGSEIIRLNAMPNSLGKIRWNIADILEPCIDRSPFTDTETDLQTRLPFIYNIKIEMDGQTVLSQTNKIVFAGGIPKYLFRRLTESKTDIFSEKLQKYTGNCFMTTRTAGEKMTLPYSEAGFLYFIGDDDAHTVVFENTANGEQYTIQVSAGVVINALSLFIVLFELGIEKGKVAVKIDGTICLTVEITAPAPGNERYMLNFRNSFGVYEMLEVTGRATNEPEYAEESIYAVYDEVTDSLRNEKLRRESADTIKVETGYFNTPERGKFIRDVLASEDVKLLGADSEWIDVIVSSEGDKMPLLMTEPVTIPLIITFREADRYYTAREQVNTMPEEIYVIATEDNKTMTTETGNMVKMEKLK